MDTYNLLLNDKTLQYNEMQGAVIQQLDRLARRMVKFEQQVLEFQESQDQLQQQHKATVEEGVPATVDNSTAGAAQRRFRAAASDPRRRTPRGMYIWGGVGTGKSLCMDLFYSTCQLPRHRKRRVHFHNFMLDIHAQVQAFKQGKHASQVHDQQEANGIGSIGGESGGSDWAAVAPKGRINLSSEADALRHVAEHLAKEVRLLCFDEFQVSDIADALIMKKLFRTLLTNGTVVVATSNRPIDDLYAGGLNRQYFVPFLSMFSQFVSEFHMDSDNDYRIQDGGQHNAAAEERFFGNLDQTGGCEVRAEFERSYASLIGPELESVDLQHNVTVPSAFGRTLVVPEAAGRVARFSFDDLCGLQSYKGAADFQALCDQFDTLVIAEIPLLTAEDPGHNSARRFITLVDQMYESGTKILCSAVASDPSKLFVADETNEPIQYTSFTVGSDSDDAAPVNDPAGQTAEYQHGKLASVLELEFAFRRASSRLSQMVGSRQRAVAASSR